MIFNEVKTIYDAVALVRNKENYAKDSKIGNRSDKH